MIQTICDQCGDVIKHNKCVRVTITYYGEGFRSGGTDQGFHWCTPCAEELDLKRDAHIRDSAGERLVKLLEEIAGVCPE